MQILSIKKGSQNFAYKMVGHTETCLMNLVYQRDFNTLRRS